MNSYLKFVTQVNNFVLLLCVNSVIFAVIYPCHYSSAFILETLRTGTLQSVAACSFSRPLLLVTFVYILVTSLSILYQALC